MTHYNDSSFGISGQSQVAVNQPYWLKSADSELQALLGFGACVAQSLMGMTQMFSQTDISVAKLDAEARMAS